MTEETKANPDDSLNLYDCKNAPLNTIFYEYIEREFYHRYFLFKSIR